MIDVTLTKAILKNETQIMFVVYKCTLIIITVIILMMFYSDNTMFNFYTLSPGLLFWCMVVIFISTLSLLIFAWKLEKTDDDKEGYLIPNKPSKFSFLTWIVNNPNQKGYLPI